LVQNFIKNVILY